MNDILNFSFTREASIPEGQYAYTLTKVAPELRVLTDDGIKDRIVFEFQLSADGKYHKFTKKFNYSKHPRSFLMQLMSIIRDAYHLDGNINLRDLNGTKGMLTISHVRDEQGNVFENITAMQAAEDSKQQ